ncbi:hypothetical protein F5X96DRAFT_685784 [Biscogniauxia mediterranea]|nr:hypothetical protein F5X96DRAFT_685784 [Biscogniauxia mediterranea]
MTHTSGRSDIARGTAFPGSPVELNFNEAIRSSRQGSSPTATISQQDFPVFTTDSNQSSWPPSSSSSLPAQSAHQTFQQQPPQQDFVLFDTPPPARTNVNRPISSPFGSLNTNRRRSSSQHAGSASASPLLQNQRVHQIIQATGHPSSPSAFTNRLNSPAQNLNQQFYASLSAPPSTPAVNQQNRPVRPPVPLFTQGIGNQQPPAKMDLQGNFFVSPPCPAQSLRLRRPDALSLEDFTAFGGGASTPAYSSPAIPGYDVNVSSASSSTTNIGTVSPHDLLIREPFTSAPNSSALTNLTSPSIYNESPDFPDTFEVSPNFEHGDFGASSSDPWFPLFPPESTLTEPAPAANSPAQKSEELEVVEATSQSRRKSGNSPSSGSHGRHSSVSGVNSRRRDKPLPPIVVDDPNDSVAMKRARNTLAARKSRERKAQRLEELEETIAKLEEERDHWKRIALSRPGA